MQIIFSDGSQLEYLSCISSPIWYQGVNRDSLTFTINPMNASLDELDKFLSIEQNILKFTQVGDPQQVLTEGGSTQTLVTTEIRDNFCIKTEIKKLPLEVGVDADGYPVYAEQIQFTLAKLTRKELDDRRKEIEDQRRDALLAQLLAAQEAQPLI